MLELFFSEFLVVFAPQLHLCHFYYHLTNWNCFCKDCELPLSLQTLLPLFNPFALSPDLLTLRCSLLRSVVCTPLTHVFITCAAAPQFLCRFLPPVGALRSLACSFLPWTSAGSFHSRSCLHLSVVNADGSHILYPQKWTLPNRTDSLVPFLHISPWSVHSSFKLDKSHVPN